MSNVNDLYKATKTPFPVKSQDFAKDQRKSTTDRSVANPIFNIGNESRLIPKRTNRSFRGK